MLFGFSEHPVARSCFFSGIWRQHGACIPGEFFVFFRSRVEAGGIRDLCCPQPVERSWFCFGFWRQQGAWIPGPVCRTCMHMRTGLYAYKPLCFRVFRHEPNDDIYICPDNPCYDVREKMNPYIASFSGKFPSGKYADKHISSVQLPGKSRYSDHTA